MKEVFIYFASKFPFICLIKTSKALQIKWMYLIFFAGFIFRFNTLIYKFYRVMESKWQYFAILCYLVILDIVERKKNISVELIQMTTFEHII